MASADASAAPAAPAAPAAAVARGRPPGRGRPRLVVAGFLTPALFFLGVWLLYPTIFTIVRSFFSSTGSSFVGVDNYRDLFNSSVLLTAIKNNALWLAIVPALVVSFGLIFAVLTERIRWKTAFKTAVFVPLAISLFAAGVIWRITDERDPARGPLNALIGAVSNAINPPGPLSGGQPSTPALAGKPSQGLVLKRPVAAGGVAQLGLTAIPPQDIPKAAKQAVVPAAKPGAVSGVVWRDFKPGGGKPGKVEQGEIGLPAVTVELRDRAGKTAAKTVTDERGQFSFASPPRGASRVAIGAQSFAAPFAGVAWLGQGLILPAIFVAYIWVWTGFALVVLAAGLAAIPRDLQEAARTDGASEWQVFRRVTVPLLAPVISVVFVTMLINVLKVFDIVLAVAPGSSQASANVIAVAVFRTAFGGANNFGLGSALAVLLFVLVIPILFLNVRNLRRAEA